MREKNVLAAILVVALILSVSASVITVSKLGPYGLFAAATASGRGEVNITEVIVITLVTNEIVIGNGTVSWDADFGYINTLDGEVINGSWANQTHNLTFRNDGNVGINVTVQFDKNAGKGNESFMCADAYGTDQTGSCGEAHFDSVDIKRSTPLSGKGALDFLFQAQNLNDLDGPACVNDSYSGAGNDGTIYGWKNNSAGWGTINSTYTEYQVCPCMRASDNSTYGMELVFKFGIPEDADGDKEVTAIFTAYKTPPADYPGCT